MKSNALFIPDFTKVTFEDLYQEVDFQQRSVTVYGKTHPQPRLTCWYAYLPYEYSNLTWPARTLPTLIQSLVNEIEAATGHRFDSCLANLYRDGQDTVGWHSDDEPVFKAQSPIASLSFGQDRDFFLRLKTDKTCKEHYVLTNQSLLVMPGGTQENWEHSLPRRKKVTEPRINLTFRMLA